MQLFKTAVKTLPLFTLMVSQFLVPWGFCPNISLWRFFLWLWSSKWAQFTHLKLLFKCNICEQVSKQFKYLFVLEKKSVTFSGQILSVQNNRWQITILGCGTTCWKSQSGWRGNSNCLSYCLNIFTSCQCANIFLGTSTFGKAWQRYFKQHFSQQHSASTQTALCPTSHPQHPN